MSCFPLTAAAYAAHIDLHNLRAWLDRGQIELVADKGRQAGAWRNAAPVDVARIAVTARLLRYGFELSECAEILADTMDRRLAELSVVDASMSAIVERLDGCWIAVSRRMGYTDVAFYGDDTGPSADREHVLILHLGAIVARAAEKLAGWRP
jgi:hypothetical protein